MGSPSNSTKSSKSLVQLELLAPIDGFVIPPMPLPQPQADDNERLPSWWGTPLEKRNLGAYLKAGVPFCQIGDPKKMQANMIIDQADVDLVADAQWRRAWLEGRDQARRTAQRHVYERSDRNLEDMTSRPPRAN